MFWSGSGACGPVYQKKKMVVGALPQQLIKLPRLSCSRCLTSVVTASCKTLQKLPITKRQSLLSQGITRTLHSAALTSLASVFSAGLSDVVCGPHTQKHV